MSGSQLKRQVEKTLQSFYSALIKSTVYTEVNACGIIVIPIIEINFKNDYKYILHDLSKKYKYGYLIPKLIVS